MDIDHPFHIDLQGRTATTDADDHVRDMIEQVLFTAPGERVNRPDFGCGLVQLVFAPNSDELAAAVQFTAQSALQRWLEDVIELQNLDVVSRDSELRVTVEYLVRRTRETQTAAFRRTL